MNVGQVLNIALSSLQASQEALRVTSNNVANVNTPNYARQTPEFESLANLGESAGVKVGDVRRVVDRFITQKFLSTGATSEFYGAQAEVYNQLQSFFGNPDSSVSLPGQISTMFQEIAALTVNSSSSVSRASAVSAIESFLSSVSRTSDQIMDIRGDINRQIAAEVNNANLLLTQIDRVNKEIVKETIVGQTPLALQDQRDGYISELSKLMDLRVNPQPDGSVHLLTESGYSLLGTLVADLSFDGGNIITAGMVPPQITVEKRNPLTGVVIQSGEVLDFRLASGEIRGLLDMRDTLLPNLAAELGNLGASVADELNAIHNNNSAIPAPNSLTGVVTGVQGFDPHNFTGRTNLVVTDQNGGLISNIELDFTAETYRVNSGTTFAFGGSSLTDVVNSINAALATTSSGIATLTNGVLQIQGNPSTVGLSFQQDTANPSDRGGRSFSHFFGLNDLVRGLRPTHFKTGVSATDSHFFTAGQTIDFVVRDKTGKSLIDRTFTVGAGNFGTIVNDLNAVGTGLGEVFNFSLSSQGELIATPNAGFEDSKIWVGLDNTSRLGSGISLTDFFGLGQHNQIEQGQFLEVNPLIKNDPLKLSLAQLDLSNTAIGTTVLSIGDNRGALALEALVNKSISFVSSGFLPSQTMTASEYTGTILADLGLRGDQNQRAQQSAEDLFNEIKERKDEVQGVNLDEELANMIVYQQSYNAAARLITAAREIMDTLLSIV